MKGNKEPRKDGGRKNNYSVIVFQGREKGEVTESKKMKSQEKKQLQMKRNDKRY